MAKKLLTVQLTIAEANALLAAIGNSLTGDPDDESSIVGTRQKVWAAYRGQSKIIRALHPKR